MKLGYARVSTYGQDLSTQEEKLHAFGCEKVFHEKLSGASTGKRKQLEAALEYCREGDALVVTKLDRLARSMFDLQRILETLQRKKVDFIVLDQKIDTSTPTGKLTFNLLGAIAEFEREIINERVREGVEKARKNGVKFGPKFKLSQEQLDEIEQRLASGESRRALMAEFNISKARMYRLFPVGQTEGR